MAARSLARVALIAVILLAVALRLHRLDGQSLWYDEGVTAEVSRWGLGELTRWTADDIQPPLYYYIVAGWGRLAGWSEWSLRFPSAAAGILLVPLLALLTYRLSGSRLAAAVAALLAAIHPLLVYYSQEARMYSLLLLLGGAAGHLLLHSTRPHSAGRAAGAGGALAWAAYVLCAAAALYTHYFAAFLILALAAAAVGDPRRRTPAALWPLLLAHLGALLLFLPWAGAMLARLGSDSSYWSGSLKLAEALRHVAVSFTSGETVLESQAVRLLPMYGAVTLAALVGLARQRPLLRIGLTWLLLPVAAVLLLASALPKFHPRYVMVALPGLLLLWSGGLSALLHGFQPLWQRARGQAYQVEARTAPALLGFVASGLLVAGALYADYGWFRDAAFTKAQWRELTTYIRREKRADEAVVLVSGHAWPVWRYYAPDLPPIRLPPIDILDVNAVVSFVNSAPPLAAGLTSHSGAWLVTWQDEVVDPMGIVTLQLEQAGKEQPLAADARFWHLGLRRFGQLDPAGISPQLPLTHPSPVLFGQRVRLLGHTLWANGDLLLFWQPLQAEPLPDLQLKAALFTADGLPYTELADGRPAGPNYPAFRWPQGQTAVGRIAAAEWAGPGALPAPYRLRVGLYDPDGDPAGLDAEDSQGHPLGKWTELTLNLAQPVPAPAAGQDRDWPLLAPGLRAALHLDRSEVVPGQFLLLTIRWLVQKGPQPEHRLLVQWRPADGWGNLRRTELAIAPTYPAEQWPLGQILRTRHRVQVPTDLPAGSYQLGVGVDGGEPFPLQAAITVEPATRLFAPPALELPLAAQFGTEIRLLGLTTALPATLSPGTRLLVTLAWQAAALPTADYAVTLQWLGPDGRPAGQVDQALPGGASSWLPGEVVTQTLQLAAPAQPRGYPLMVAVYAAQQPGLPRLPLADGRDALRLGSVVVAP